MPRDKIFILEDKTDVSVNIAEIVELCGYASGNIYRASEFKTADEFTRKSPSCDNFQHFIVDLCISAPLSIKISENYFSTKEKTDILKLSETVALNGWIWLKRLIRDYNDIKPRVIVLSAYVDQLPESEKTAYGKGITFLLKTNTSADIDLLIENLNKGTRWNN